MRGLTGALQLLAVHGLQMNAAQQTFFDIAKMGQDGVNLIIEKARDAGLLGKRRKAPEMLAQLDERSMLSLERAPSTSEELYTKNWETRWHAVKKLGSGGFGEAWLVKSLTDNALAVAKRAPHPTRKGDYVRWGDYKAGDPSIDEAIEGMRDECTWAYWLQKFGVEFRYATRFLFMQCWETNIPADNSKNHPNPNHELYLIVNFAGKQLNEVEFKTVPAMGKVIQQLTNSLHYMKIAGIVHHDLKGPNILYTENVDAKGQTAGGHIVVIDFGAMFEAEGEATEVHTPGFAPFGFGLQPIVPATSYDTFSMAGTISEVLCGANLMYNWVDRYTLQTSWPIAERYLTNVDLFSQIAVQTCRETDARTGSNRAALLIEFTQEYPEFMTFWRRMFSSDANKRDEAANDMWRLFLYHDKDKAAKQQEHEWNNMLLKMPANERQLAIQKANGIYQPDERVKAAIAAEQARNLRGQAAEANAVGQIGRYPAYRGQAAHYVANQLLQDRQHQQMQGAMQPMVYQRQQ